MRILLVEDDRDVAEYIRRELEDEGHAVSVCHDGASGLRAAELTAFDIIVLDGDAAVHGRTGGDPAAAPREHPDADPAPDRP